MKDEYRSLRPQSMGNAILTTQKYGAVAMSIFAVKQYAMRAIKVLALVCLWAIVMPLSASLIWGIGTAPVFWGYGLVVAILLAPYSFVICLPASVWLGTRAAFGPHISGTETLIVSVVGSAAVFWTVDPELVLWTTVDVPDTNSAGLAYGQLFMAIFAISGALATLWLGRRLGFLR